MGEVIKLNHHSAAVLPYHLDLEGRLHFVLEQKDPKYKAPYFDNGLNFLGGNWEKGVNTDLSPKDVVERETPEEFWDKYEAPESLNSLLGQEFLKREPEVMVKYDLKSVERIKQVGKIVGSSLGYAGNYIVRVLPPITKSELVYGSSIFTRVLSEQEFKTICDVAQEFEGRLTTDNLKWGSKTVVVTLDDINHKNRKFSWGYCNMVNMMFQHSFLPKQPCGVARPLNLVKIEGMPLPLQAETFEDIEKEGYAYLEKKK